MTLTRGIEMLDGRSSTRRPASVRLDVLHLSLPDHSQRQSRYSFGWIGSSFFFSKLAVDFSQWC